MSLKQFIKHRQNIPILRADDTVTEAIQQMIEQKSGVVLVASDGKSLEGLFTDRDVMIRITAAGLDPADTLLREVMTTDLAVASEDTEIADAIQILVEHRIRHLPILDSNNELIGMISLRYLLHDRVNELLAELRGLEAYFNDAPGG